jgi:hypothetical protein
MLDVIIDALAVYRLTRLLTEDAILEQPRADLEAALTDAGHPLAAEGIRCPWCVGMYVAGAVTVLSTLAPRPWRPLARALALSAITGALSERV